jgi:hypothetical protein
MPQVITRRRPLQVAAGLAMAMACLVGTACSATGPGASASSSATTPAGSSTRTSADGPAAPTSPVPPGLAAVAGDEQAGVHGRLLQFRRDVERRRLEIRLVAMNAGLVIEQLDLRAPGLTIEPAQVGEDTLRTEPGLDLPVTMGLADCTVQPGPPVVELRIRDEGGARRTVDVPLEDDGLVRRLHDEDCAQQALRAEADINVVGTSPVQTPHGPGMRISVQLRRIAGADPVRVTGTRSNTVYDLTAVGALPTLRNGSVELQVDMVPARCDAHALGDSYRTGLIGLDIAVGKKAPQPYVLTPADDVRHSLETFAVTTCRRPTD